MSGDGSETNLKVGSGSGSEKNHFQIHNTAYQDTGTNC
jgi:hypothetical protein